MLWPKKNFSSRFFGQLCASLGAFPVKRGEVDLNAMKRALQILKNQEVLGIFPEGTRSKTGALGSCRTWCFGYS
ncbi:MAG: 1-acyl-sn-glycerol-3-phosphate acyltransferase [Acidaminococcaceae bacterium]|nr:1-acyl-sn-glycerol-3-phosphate acyltransferase [Acidaminococcaceae bacterium]